MGSPITAKRGRARSAARAERSERDEHEASSIARRRGGHGPRAVHEAPEGVWTPPGFTRALPSERGAGAPVPAPARAELAPLLGGAAERARLHTGTSADRLTGRLGALAFTHGDDVVMSARVAPLRTPFQLAILTHELVHVEQQRGRPPVVQPYIDPCLARIDESKLGAESADDLQRMEREVIEELKGGSPRNKGDSEWNLAIIQAELVRKGKPITHHTNARFAIAAEDHATPEQILALQTRIDVVSALAESLFKGGVGTLVARLKQWRADFEHLHKDAVFDEGEKIVSIQSTLEAASRIQEGTPTEASSDPAVAAAQTAVFDAVRDLLRDLGTAAQSTRATALAKASEHYADVFSTAMIGAVQQAKALMAGADAAPPKDSDIFINGFAQNNQIVVGGSLSELGTYTFAREQLQDDLKALGDLDKLKSAPYKDRAAFMDREGKNLPKLLRRAQALALMRSAFSAGSALLDATTQQTTQAVWTDALDARTLRNKIVVPLAAGLESSEGPTEGQLASARSQLDRLEKTIRDRLKDVAEYQKRVGYFMQFAVLVMSMYGGMAAARLAAGPVAPGATLTAGQLVRSSLAFSSTSMVITAGLTGHVPTAEQQLMQYATDLATFGLMHGIGMGLAGRYGGAANVPAGIKVSAEVSALWIWSTSLGLAQHLDKGGGLTGQAAAKIAGEAAEHTAMGLMAMHLAHHVGSLPGVSAPQTTDPAVQAKYKVAVAEFERVRNEGKAIEKELSKWREQGEAAPDMDPVLARAERFYGSYRKAVRGLADAGVIEPAQADVLVSQAAPLQVTQNIRTAAKLGLRTAGEHSVGYSADVRNVDMFLRQLQRQGQVKSFEPTGRNGIYRVQQSDGSWALWFPEGPPPESAKKFDLPSNVLAETYPNLTPEVRARALANLSRLSPADTNRVLAMMSGAEGEAMVKWMARGDVGTSRFLTADMLQSFLHDPAMRQVLTTESPDVIQRWHDVPFEKVTGDRSGASFIRFLAMVKSYRGGTKVANRAEALDIAGELARTTEPREFDPLNTYEPRYFKAPGSPTPPKSPAVQISEQVRQQGLTGTFHEVDAGGLTYIANVDGGTVSTIYIFRGSKFIRGVPVADKVSALQAGIKNAEAITDPAAQRSALDALAPLAEDLAFLRDVRSVPVGDIVPLINKVKPRAAQPLPDVLPPEPESVTTPKVEVPITRAEAARQRRQQLLDRAQRMGESEDAMVQRLRAWNPDVPGNAKKVANPDVLMSGIETYLDALQARRLGRVLTGPPRGCFAADTPVWLDGGPGAIAGVADAAVAVAIDGEGREARAAVAGRIQVQAARTLIVRISDNSSIRTTAEHPFWVRGRGWRGAEQLAAGDQLWARRGPLSVIAVEDGGPCEVWNLEVAGLHTFLAGDAGVLVHNKAMPAVSKQLGVLEVAKDAEYTYRSGGTFALEKELEATGGKVIKTFDKATGLRTLTLELPGQAPIVMRERGRYADVRIEVAALDPIDQTRINGLFTRYGITDPMVQGRILEAIEANRITTGGRTPPDISSAIGKVKGLLDAARAEGNAMTPKKTAEQVLADRGNVPLADAESLKLLPEAQKAIADGILSDPRFLEARTREEVRDILAGKMQAEVAAERATTTHGLTGGKVVSRMRIRGNLYDTETTSVIRRQNTDVVPDLDLAYVVETGGVFEVKYGANAKTSRSGAAGDAAKQNVLAQKALSSSGRFEVTTREGTKLWAEVTSVEAVQADGAVVDMSGKVKWGSGAVTETIGSHGSTGYDVTMPEGSKASRLDRIADLIWRLRELQSRPHLVPP